MSTNLRGNSGNSLVLILLCSSTLTTSKRTFSETFTYAPKRSTTGQSILKAVPKDFQQLLCETDILVLIQKLMT